MLQNAYFVAKIGADTAENEQHSAEILPTDALGRLVSAAPTSSESPADPAAACGSALRLAWNAFVAARTCRAEVEGEI